MEEGRILETTPLTQANSSNDGDEDGLAVLLEGGFQRPNSTRAKMNVVGDGDDKGVVPKFAAVSSSGVAFVGSAAVAASASAEASARGLSRGATYSVGGYSGAIAETEVEPIIVDHAYDHLQRERGNRTKGGRDTELGGDDGDRCLQSPQAAPGRSTSRGRRGVLDSLRSDNEGHDNNDIHRCVNRNGSRYGLVGDLQINTNERGGFDEDGHVSELHDGESQTTRSAVWREFLVPIKLLQDKRVRAILFVYGLYSVRSTYVNRVPLQFGSAVFSCDV